MGAEATSQWYSICQREHLTSDAQNPWKARCGDIPVIPALLQQEWSGCRGTSRHWCTENNINSVSNQAKSQDPHQSLSSDLHTVTSSHILTLMYTAVNNMQLSPSRWRARTHTKAPQPWCLTSCPPIFTQTQTSFAHTHKHTKNRTTKFTGYTFSTTKHWPYLNMFNNIGLRTISVLSTVITSSMAVGTCSTLLSWCCNRRSWPKPLREESVEMAYTIQFITGKRCRNSNRNLKAGTDEARPTGKHCLLTVSSGILSYLP